VKNLSCLPVFRQPAGLALAALLIAGLVLTALPPLLADRVSVATTNLFASTIDVARIITNG